MTCDRFDANTRLARPCELHSTDWVRAEEVIRPVNPLVQAVRALGPARPASSAARGPNLFNCPLGVVDRNRSQVGGSLATSVPNNDPANDCA
jgi:hypothetical protein